MSKMLPNSKNWTNMGVHLIHQMVPADSAEDFMELLNKKGWA